MVPADANEKVPVADLPKDERHRARRYRDKDTQYDPENLLVSSDPTSY